MLKTCSLTDSSPIMSMIASMVSFRAPSTFFSRSHSNCEGVLSSGGGVAVAVTFNFTVGDLMVWVDIVGVFDAGCGSPGSFSFVVVARLLKDFASSRSRSFCRIASCLSLSSRISRILCRSAAILASSSAIFLLKACCSISRFFWSPNASSCLSAAAFASRSQILQLGGRFL